MLSRLLKKKHVPFCTRFIFSVVRFPAWMWDIFVHPPAPFSPGRSPLCAPGANLHGQRSSPCSMAIASVHGGHEQEVSGREDSEVRVIILCSLPTIEGLSSCQPALSFPTSLLHFGTFSPSRIVRPGVVNDHCSPLVWELYLAIAFNPGQSISSSFIMDQILVAHLPIHVVSCGDLY